MTTSINIIQPDDWHVHFREDEMLKVVTKYSARVNRRCIAMPNTSKPITTSYQAINYKKLIESNSQSKNFEALIPCYLTDSLNIDDFTYALQNKIFIGGKLYPSNATTNSQHGVNDIKKIYNIFEILEKEDSVLLIHGELNRDDIDIFDREKIFIEKNLINAHKEFPDLRIVLEHISTKESTEFVKETSNNIAATITPQHLLYNRNELFAGGLKPHAFCLPVLKREEHRVAVLGAAISGNPKFFLGTDSAPHKKSEKESSCGCAGIYSALNAMEIYAEIFDRNNAIEKLENFSSKFGADFYRLSQNKNKIKLVRSSNKVPNSIKIDNGEVIPLLAGQEINWNCSAV